MEVLLFKFFHHCPWIAQSGPPGNVVHLAAGRFVIRGGDSFGFRFVGVIRDKVLEMQADDPSMEFLEAFDRVQAGTLPMPDIGANTDERRTVLDGREDEVGVPVMVGPGMLVDCNLDVVFLAKFFDGVHGGVLRLGDKGVNAGLFCEFKNLAALRLVRGKQDDADVDELDAETFCVVENGLELFVSKVNGFDGFLFANVATAGEAHVFETEGGGLINGFVDGIFLEGVGVHVELPAELVAGLTIGRRGGLSSGG